MPWTRLVQWEGGPDFGQAPDISVRWQERLAESNTLIVISYVIAAVVAAICLSTGSATGDPGIVRLALVLALAFPAGFLLVFSAFGLIAYFLFIPRFPGCTHFCQGSRRAQLVHPLTTAVLLGLLALAIYTGSLPGLAVWLALLGSVLASDRADGKPHTQRAR